MDLVDSSSSFAKEMQTLAKRKRVEMRQAHINSAIEGTPPSPATKRRTTFLSVEGPRLIDELKTRVRRLAKEGDVSMRLYAGSPQRERSTDDEMVSFYVSRYPSVAPVFRCARDDQDYVLETIVEAMVSEGFSIERYPPRPETPMSLIRIIWLNL